MRDASNDRQCPCPCRCTIEYQLLQIEFLLPLFFMSLQLRDNIRPGLQRFQPSNINITDGNRTRGFCVNGTLRRNGLPPLVYECGLAQPRLAGEEENITLAF